MLQVFAFNSPFAEFDPYLVFAETEEEATEKIRQVFPYNLFNVYKPRKFELPGVAQGNDIYTNSSLKSVN